MPSLLTLATEMLQAIIDQVNPDDLVSFSLCCKEVYTTATPRLSKHREQIKHYSKLQYSACLKDVYDDHPAKILREICLDDHIAFYLRSLSIGFPEDKDRLKDNENLSRFFLKAKQPKREILPAVFDEFGSTIDEKLSKALCYNDKNISPWRQYLKEGTRGAFFCLLLLLLPNLEQIHLTYTSFDDEILENLLEMVAGGIHYPDETSSPTALTKLSRVFLKGPEEVLAPGQIIASLAALPSLRTLIATSFCADSESYPIIDDLGWPYEQHISGITELNLQSSNVSVASFVQLLGGIKCLKSFTYDCLYGDFYGVPVSRVIGMLLEHAKASLEFVAFTGRHRYVKRGSCSFKQFKVLKEIRMHSAYFFKNAGAYQSTGGWVLGDGSRGTKRLVDLLPASIRSVQIDGALESADVALLLEGLTEHKADFVPHLESVNFTYFADLCARIRENRDFWREDCRTVGVKLSL